MDSGLKPMTKEELLRKAYQRLADALILMADVIEDPPREVVNAKIVFLPRWKPKSCTEKN